MSEGGVTSTINCFKIKNRFAIGFKFDTLICITPQLAN